MELCCSDVSLALNIRNFIVVPRGFCFSNIMLAPNVRIFAEGPKGIILFGRVVAAHNSYFRSGGHDTFANLALGRHVGLALYCFVQFLYRKVCVYGKSIGGGKAIVQWVCNWSLLVGFPIKRTEGSVGIPRGALSQF